MNSDQRQTIVVIAIAFVVGLLMSILGGCDTETQTRSTILDGSDPGHVPSRGPGNATNNMTTEDAAPFRPIQDSGTIDVTPALDTTPDQGKTDLATPDLAAPDLLTPDLPSPDIILAPDLTPDLAPDLAPKSTDTMPNHPDNAPLLALGNTCQHDNQCQQGHCTNEVCCTVAKCVDTCDPSRSACPPYNGWTCAPYGTCRAY
jgi:hypothetical protein